MSFNLYSWPRQTKPLTKEEVRKVKKTKPFVSKQKEKVEK